MERDRSKIGQDVSKLTNGCDVGNLRKQP